MTTDDHLASRLATDWVTSGAANGWRSLEGTAVLADLTGFTRLTEQLLDRRGAEGAELLSRALNLCFGALLAPALRAGGDVVGFAGDAALVWFDGDHHQRRAAEAALAMPAGLAKIPASLTAGQRIRVSIGAHTGQVLAVMTGVRQRAMFLCGPQVSRLVALESAAEAGQVVMSDELASRLRPEQRGAAVGPGWELRRRQERRAAPPVAAPADVGHGFPEAAKVLLAPSIRPVFSSGGARGEHRSVSIGFVAITGIDDLLATAGPDAVAALLDETVATVDAVTAELGVTWFDVDVGPGSVRLLLAAGAPDAVERDELRLLGALRRIVDASSHPLRAGAQRGRVFVGPFGVEGRRTLTLLGDAVNTAARALGQAGDRELVAADGLGAERLDGTVVALGDRPLKNKARPVALWRIDALGTDAATPETVRATPSARPRERERLASMWKDVVDGTGAALRIEGEPGMGVSELLAELVDRAGTAATSLVADASRRQVPLALVASMVRSLAIQGGSTSTEDPVEWLASFRTLVDPPADGWVDDALDALRRRVHHDDPDPMATARRARAALVALIGAAAPAPWLLAIDDHDATDDASRTVVELLRRAATDRSWFIVTASSSGGPDEPGISTLEVGPLDREAAVEVLREVAPLLRPDQIERILAAAGGNPFVLTELATNPRDGELPDSLERLASIGIDQLPVTVRRLVRDASAFGRTLDLAVVAAVLARPELEDVDAWAAAMPLLRAAGDGVLVFRHDAYRQAAHRSLSFARRRELHGAIADHLAERPDADPAVLAGHYEEAGRRREAYPPAVTAAKAALAAGALVEATVLLDQAARLAGHVDPDAAGPLLLELADTSIRLGDLDAGSTALRRAARLITDPLDYGLMCSHRALLDTRRGRVKASRTWIRRGLEVTAPLGDAAAEIQARLLVDDVFALSFLGRYDDALPIARKSLDAAERSGDRYRVAMAHSALEMVLSGSYDPEADEHGEAAIRLFDELGLTRDLGVALLNSGLTAMFAGRWTDALELYRRSIEVSVSSGDLVNAAIPELNSGFLLLRQGRVADADERASSARRVFSSVEHPVMTAYTHYLSGACAAREGRFDDADRALAEARRMFDAAGDQTMVADCDVAMVERLLLERRHAEALELAARLTPQMTRVPDAALVAMHRVVLGVATARTGDAAAGAAILVDALAMARGHRLVYEAHRCLAALTAIESAGGPAAPDGAAAERDELAERLGLVGPALLPAGGHSVLG